MSHHSDRIRDLVLAATALLDWAREHTGPRDENSPHALLITLRAALAAMEDC